VDRTKRGNDYLLYLVLLESGRGGEQKDLRTIRILLPWSEFHRSTKRLRGVGVGESDKYFSFEKSKSHHYFYQLCGNKRHAVGSGVYSDYSLGGAALSTKKRNAPSCSSLNDAAWALGSPGNQTERIRKEIMKFKLNIIGTLSRDTDPRWIWR